MAQESPNQPATDERSDSILPVEGDLSTLPVGVESDLIVEVGDYVSYTLTGKKGELSWCQIGSGYVMSDEGDSWLVSSGEDNIVVSKNSVSMLNKQYRFNI
jgi:hypothetical protein